MAQAAAAQEVVRTLRRDIAKIEGRLAETLSVPADQASGRPARRSATVGGTGLPTGLLEIGSARLDAALGGGLPASGLVEVHARETRDAGASAGFVLGLLARLRHERQPAPLLWIATTEILREAGTPHGPGLRRIFGIGARDLLLAPVRHLADGLWIAEEAAGQLALGAVVLELRGSPGRLDLVATRRLHLRAERAGRLLVLLRQGVGAKPAAEPTAAPVRLVVAPAPAGVRQTLAAPLPRSIGPPRFLVSIDRSRTARPLSATLEWNRHERRFLDRNDERPDAVRTPRTPHPGAVVPLSADRKDHAPALRPDVARAAGRGR